MLRALIAAVLVVLLPTGSVLADATSPPIDPDVKACVDAEAQAQRDTMKSATGEDLALFADSPKYTHNEVANCLFKLKRYQEAKAEWEAYRAQINDDRMQIERMTYFVGLAETDAALRQSSDAVNLMNRYYELAHENMLFDYWTYLRLTRGVMTPGKIANRRYWAALSADMQHVVKLEGGSQEYNERSRPCHVSRFATPREKKVTWWYCARFSDQRVKAYDFLNGKLISTFTP